MRIKSYFVKSVDEAIAQARVELGADALLLRTRKTEALPNAPARYEVVFGTPAPEATAQPAEATPAPAATIPAPMSQEPPAPVAAQVEDRTVALRENAPSELEQVRGLEQVRAQMDELHRLLLANAIPAANRSGIPELGNLYRRLVESGIDAKLASEISRGVESAIIEKAPELLPKRTFAVGWRRFDQKKFGNLVRTEIGARIRVDPTLGMEGAPAAVVAMIGPSGAGKTTTLMKIAAFEAGPGRNVRFIALDASGIGGRMQLQFFARKSNVALTVVEKPEELPALVRSAGEGEVVLIDPGPCGSAAEMEKLAKVFAKCPRLDVHLVVPGYLTAAAARLCMGRFKTFRPRKLVITKLDETPSWGAVVSEATQARLSLSLLSNGPAVPKDFRQASLDDLLPLAIEREAAETACA